MFDGCLLKASRNMKVKECSSGARSALQCSDVRDLLLPAACFSAGGCP